MSEFLEEQEAYKNSEFLRQADIRRKIHLIDGYQYKAFVNAYKEKDEETKAIYDENAELYFSDKANEMGDNIKKIKNNVQFFFWITMISLIATIVILLNS